MAIVHAPPVTPGSPPIARPAAGSITTALTTSLASSSVPSSSSDDQLLSPWLGGGGQQAAVPAGSTQQQPQPPAAAAGAAASGAGSTSDRVSSASPGISAQLASRQQRHRQGSRHGQQLAEEEGSGPPTASCRLLEGLFEAVAGGEGVVLEGLEILAIVPGGWGAMLAGGWAEQAR